MSAERNNIQMGELRNPRGPSRKFRMIRKVKVPVKKWVKIKKSEQWSNSSIFVVLIPSVIGLLQVAHLFKTRTVNMWISVVALVIHCLSQAIMKKINQTRWTSFFGIIDRFRVLSGVLVPMSLLSIFLPDPFWWLFFAIWLLLAFIVVLYRWIYLGVMKAIHSEWSTISNRFMEGKTVQPNVLARQEV